MMNTLRTVITALLLAAGAVANAATTLVDTDLSVPLQQALHELETQLAADLGLEDVSVQPLAGTRIDKVVGIEARGFILGGAIAHQLSIGFVPVRKRGKLPWKTLSQEYQLEYGTDSMEIHIDAIQPNENILIVDDLIATGGTAAATAALVTKLGGTVVECAFVIELAFLKGREKLKPYPVFSILQYPSE